jgi:hypothetical protein
MSKIELFFYVFSTVILIIIGVYKRFSDDFINLVGSVSGALVLMGIVATAVALLWRRVSIRLNKSTYGDKAEVVERSVADTVIYVAKGVAGVWVLLVVIGFIELLKQHI